MSRLKGFKHTEETKRKLRENHKGLLGKKHSEETKRKMSIARKGKKQNPEHIRKRAESLKGFKQSLETIAKRVLKLKGRKAWNKGIEMWKNKKHPRGMFGKKLSLETRKKMSENLRGEKCYAWKGGITPRNLIIRRSLEYKLWREAIFARDNYTCIWCGDDKGGNLNADHIKPFALYPELRFAIDNGRTLCEECHKKTDTYGNKYKKK